MKTTDLSQDQLMEKIKNEHYLLSAKTNFANKKVEYLHCVQKMKLAMNSTIYFHVIILITKENYTLNLILEIVLIL